MSNKWTQEQTIELCRKIECICPKFGCHVALTGGTLYKEGERKDADILFYRIRQVTHIDVFGLMEALYDIGVKAEVDYGWCYKANYEGKPIDFFFPEREDGDDEYSQGTREPDSLSLALQDEVAF